MFGMRGSSTRKPDTYRMIMTLDAIKQHIGAGKLDDADRALSAASETEENRFDLLILRGHLHEARYDRESAVEAYETVLEQDPGHPEATFHAARLAELYGNDPRAIELYERCVAREEVGVHALINLAYLYEERGQLNRANACLRNVLAEFPNHPRARGFLKSVQCSYTMAYDEKALRERERSTATMDAPIVDFELSVRSRNCLRQMNLRTLGDLLRVTESELLSYKNFGETSLNEIKAVLGQMGLRLGQALQPPEQSNPPATPEPPGDGAANLNKPVSELELSVRARKCLQMLGVLTLGELATRSENELLTLKNFGQTSLIEIQKQLAKFGLAFRS